MQAPTRPAQDNAILALLVVLSLTTGLVDAVSVLGLGKVFTANMTGNVVFLGFAVVGAPGFTVLPFLVALAAFLVGAVAGGRTAALTTTRSRRDTLVIAALAEAALLWTAAVVALDYDIATLQPTASLVAIIALTALAMGLRNAVVRQLKVADMTTTVLTQTLTGLAADSTLGGGVNPNWGRRVASVTAIFVGAALGAVLVLSVGLSLPLALAGALVLSSTLVVVARPLPPPA